MNVIFAKGRRREGRIVSSGSEGKKHFSDKCLGNRQMGLRNGPNAMPTQNASTEQGSKPRNGPTRHLKVVSSRKRGGAWVKVESDGLVILWIRSQSELGKDRIRAHALIRPS